MHLAGNAFRMTIIWRWIGEVKSMWVTTCRETSDAASGGPQACHPPRRYLSTAWMSYFFLFIVFRKFLKGRKQVFGWFWIISMAYVSISSFWIRSLNEGNYSFIHILSIWTLICLVLGIYYIRKKKRKMHYAFTIGPYIGLLIAGILTLLPGRFFDEVFNLFG